MSEINTDDTTFTDDPAINIGIPPYGIDLKVILMAVRDYLLWEKLQFAKEAGKTANIIIPTLRESFTTEYVDGYIILNQRKSYRIPVTFDGPDISEETINIMCACLEKTKVNCVIF